MATIATLSNPALSGEHLLDSHEMSLENRYPDKGINSIFKDNILLNMAYFDDRVKSTKDINWDSVEQPFKYEFKLKPGKTFAFQDDVLPEYKDKVDVTTHAHFNYQEGFKSDGYLVGDGVCHLASLIYWVAKDAGLNSYAPSNHDFAVIPDIGKEYGVAIYSNPGSPDANAHQNLYITNNKDKPVTFRFEYKENKLSLAILEDN